MVRLSFFVFCILFLIFLAGLPVQAKHAQSFAGPVPATIVKIIDGDTIDVRVQTWIGQYMVTTVRIRGIDAPEFRSRCKKEKILAKKARQALESLITRNSITLRNIEYGKYAGRVLADIYIGNQNIAEWLVQKSYTRSYDGKKRQDWC